MQIKLTTKRPKDTGFYLMYRVGSIHYNRPMLVDVRLRGIGSDKNELEVVGEMLSATMENLYAHACGKIYWSEKLDITK